MNCWTNSTTGSIRIVAHLLKDCVRYTTVPSSSSRTFPLSLTQLRANHVPMCIRSPLPGANDSHNLWCFRIYFFFLSVVHGKRKIFRERKKMTMAFDRRPSVCARQLANKTRDWFSTRKQKRLNENKIDNFPKSHTRARILNKRNENFETMKTTARSPHDTLITSERNTILVFSNKNNRASFTLHKKLNTFFRCGCGCCCSCSSHSRNRRLSKAMSVCTWMQKSKNHF